MNRALLEAAAEKVGKQFAGARPACGLILGSGWTPVAESFALRGQLDYAALPGLGRPGVAGHAGTLYWGELAGLEALIFQGRRHWYEGEGWTPVALPVYVLKQLGVGRLLLTNAAGGIAPTLRPGMFMVIGDHINAMGASPLVGPHDPFWGPRFPDQSGVYDPELRVMIERGATRAGESLAHGTYLCVSGPAYETPAEIRAYATLGADAVGMSAVPEAALAHAAGLRVAGISFISNYAAGMSDGPLSHDDVVSATRDALPRMKALIAGFWQELAESPA